MRDLNPPSDERAVALRQPRRPGHGPERDALQPRQDLTTKDLGIRLGAMRCVPLPELPRPLGHLRTAPSVRGLAVQ
jgi:hypothetical protein